MFSILFKRCKYITFHTYTNNKQNTSPVKKNDIQSWLIVIHWISVTETAPMIWNWMLYLFEVMDGVSHKKDLTIRSYELEVYSRIRSWVLANSVILIPEHVGKAPNWVSAAEAEHVLQKVTYNVTYTLCMNV